jgi:ferritin-like metal-binding protein YciE
MSATTFDDLFLDMLKDIYYAEKKILKALPKLAKHASNAKLINAFEKHHKETEVQIDRLERVFKEIGKKPMGKKCEAIEGLNPEADELIEEVEDPAVLDAGLLAGARAVEHYEMARYRALVSWAEALGHNQSAKLLQQTLDEETKTNELLMRLAEEQIIAEACASRQDEGQRKAA